MSQIKTKSDRQGSAPGARQRANRKGADRAAEIMTVALDLFAEKDYAAVTTTEIARIIGVRHSLIYYYFASKDALFHETIQNFIHETIRNYERMHDLHDDPVDRIEYWFENNIELSRPLRKLIKIMFDYSGPKGRPHSTDKAIRKFYDLERSILSSGIREGIARGVFKNVDPEQTAAFVSTHIDGIFFSSLMREDVDLVDSMGRLKVVLWQMLDHPDAGQRRKSPRRRPARQPATRLRHE